MSSEDRTGQENEIDIVDVDDLIEKRRKDFEHQQQSENDSQLSLKDASKDIEDYQTFETTQHEEQYADTGSISSKSSDKSRRETTITCDSDSESETGGIPDRASLSADGRFLQHVTSLRRESAPHSFAWKKLFTIPATIFLPIATTLAVFCLPPLGDPDGNLVNKLVYLLIVNPTVYCIYSGLLTILCYAAVDTVGRLWFPFLLYLPPIIAVYVVEVVVMFLIYPFTNTFPIMGIIPFFLGTTTTLIALHFVLVSMKSLDQDAYTRFIAFCKIVIAMSIFIVFLAAWVIWFQTSGDAARSGLPFLLWIVVFIFKKYFLAVTDAYPYEIAMIISGLWLENLDDVFQSLVFAVVPADSFFLYAVLFARKFLENIAYLGFLTNHWFRFRVWIKDFLKRLFCCKLDTEKAQPIWDDDNPNDRGHSNEQPGYLRRQMHFYFYKIVSQLHSYINYVIVAAAFREGYNQQYFPLGTTSSAVAGNDCLTDRRFRISIIFTAISFAVVLFTDWIGYRVFKQKHPNQYKILKDRYQNIIFSPIFLGFVITILTSSSLLAFSVVTYHNRIWFIEKPLNITCSEDDD